MDTSICSTAGILEMLSNKTITNFYSRSLEAYFFEAARQSLSSSQILWQQQLGFSRPAAGWIQPAARDYISAAPTSPVASHFLLRPIRGDLRPIRGDLTNHRTFHQIVGTRKSWSSRRQQTKQHFFPLHIDFVFILSRLLINLLRWGYWRKQV